MKNTWKSRLRALVLCTTASLLIFQAAVAAEPQHDPLEPLNRAVFQLNEATDRWLLRPVASTYKNLAPAPAQKGIGNALRNLRDANYALNTLLQGRFVAALSNLGRFALNSTLGLAGIIDVATKSGMESTQADFGQTLATWGVPAGPFVMLPVIGPSTFRDGAGFAADTLALSVPAHIESDEATQAIWGTAITHTRAQLTNLDDLITGDRYVFFRNAYLQRRAALLGEVPRSDDGAVKSLDVFGEFDDELMRDSVDDL